MKGVQGGEVVRIAEVSPLFESVPPRYYGGTERIVSFLTEELVCQGHDVTLFASGDSVTEARLVPCARHSLRLDPSVKDSYAHHIAMLDRVTRLADHFDVIHFHTDFLHLPVARLLDVPSVTTLHGRLDLPDLLPLYHTFDDAPLVSISDAQRVPLAFANWARTVYHGLPLDLLHHHPERGEYLAFLGRVSPEKRLDRAINVARALDIPLKIAAKIDQADRPYYESVIKPSIDGRLIEFVGEIGEREKDEFLGHAIALMFLIDWPEPFGLVMIEAMACGTPVVAWRHGSVPEVMKDGVSGYVVDRMEAAIAATRRATSLSRDACRNYFERRFSVARMAHDYAELYASLATGAQTTITGRSSSSAMTSV